jgi:L-amino acid N-acyltransferase
MNIRKALLSDADAIAAIYNQAILETTATFDTEIKSTTDRQQWLLNHSDNYPVLVAEMNKTVVGFASLSRWSDRSAYDLTAELSIYISPKVQGNGIGNILMETIIKKGKEGGLHCILSRITQGNEASIYLHKKYGFETVGVMKEVGKKFGNFLDVTIMQLLYK